MKKLVVLVVLLFAVSYSTPAHSQPAGGHYVEYYSDASFTEIVGTYYADCGSAGHLTGVRTGFSYSDDWDCGDTGYHTCYTDYTNGDGSQSVVPEPCR